MSSVNPKVTSLPGAPSSARARAAVEFRDLAEGLHALAQPLSGLRSAVELLNILPGEERYRQICASEIERACSIFANLQNLLAVEAMEAKVNEFDCSQLVNSLVAEQQLPTAFQAGISAAMSAGAGLVRGDERRTRDAFLAVLRVLANVCGTEGAVEASRSQLEGLAVFRFAVRDRNRNRLDSSDRLQLSLARACLVSQGGEFQAEHDPLAIRMALPLA